MARTVDYDEWLINRLRDKNEAASYLKESLLMDEEISLDENRKLLGLALCNIGKAHGVSLSVSTDEAFKKQEV